MKVLLVNKFYYFRGGDCLVAMGIERILRENGHQTAFFAMQYPGNIDSEWTNYFPSEVSFSGGGISSKIASLKRIAGKGDVAERFSALMDEFDPDIVHLNNIHSYLSPVVAEIARKKGAKVVWTLHDYKLICPAYLFLREGKVCELCLENDCSVVTKKCMKGSLPASLIAYMEAKIWNKKRLSAITDTFICPSRFMKQKMLQAGFPEEKLAVLPNFIPTGQDNLIESTSVREKAYCYIGRLSNEKGIELLLAAANHLPYKLYIAGTGDLLADLKYRYESDKIVFLGQLSRSQIYDLLREVSFSVIPSVWFENNPLSVIESLCLGTPVLGASIGGIPELIEPEKNGLLFELGSVDDLTRKIELMFKYVDSAKFISSSEIRQKAVKAFSENIFYQGLLDIYSSGRCKE